MVCASWHIPEAEILFCNQIVFDQLRFDLYYRTTASRHPDLRPQFEKLLGESALRRVSLVHGDWSPKNFLVSPAGVMAIDFEVIHFGDPSFDSAFLLNHLLLKSFHRPEWSAKFATLAGKVWEVYRAGLPPGCDWIEPATLSHLGCLLLARIDGKSPAEYITEPALQARVRQFGRRLISSPPAHVADVFERAQENAA
jgi:5-methylthioribose kinase